MDIAGFLFNKDRFACAPVAFRDKVRNRLFVPQDGQKPYEHIFLLKWVWPCGPHGAKLGNDVVVAAHEGVVLTVGPSYALPVNDCHDVRGLWAKARTASKATAHYVCLKPIDTSKPMVGQKLAVLVGTHAPTATAPDGMICLDVKKALANGLGL